MPWNANGNQMQRRQLRLHIMKKAKGKPTSNQCMQMECRSQTEHLSRPSFLAETDHLLLYQSPNMVFSKKPQYKDNGASISSTQSDKVGINRSRAHGPQN